MALNKYLRRDCVERIRSVKLSWLIGIVIGIFIISACDFGGSSTEEPPAIPNPEDLVTHTLQLPNTIISQTPIFTASFTPSNTPTATNTQPSATPTETGTATPTITITSTATLAGAVDASSENNRRLREGPGLEFDVIASISGDTGVGILGFVENYQGEEWYQINYFDEDGQLIEGFMRSDLVDDLDQTIPPLNPTEAPTNTPPPITGTIPTIAPFETVAPVITYSPTPADATVAPSEIGTVNIRAGQDNLGCRPVDSADSDETVSIFWSWVARTPEQIQDHIDHVEYEILLDGRLLSTWRQYNVVLDRDTSEGNLPSVYWYVPVGQLPIGEHTLSYRVTWNEAIFDGDDNYGPGTDITEETGECTFIIN